MRTPSHNHCTRSIVPALAGVLGLFAVLLMCRGAGSARANAAESAVPAQPKPASVPVIYCTDLFHPHEDPDDHFDLATIYAIPELDLKCIILDQGDKQAQRPGRIPVSQMNKITGRDVPALPGLGQKLKSPADKALDQPREFQHGVTTILTTLQQSPVPVMIAAVGSVRDVVAAFNRAPGLFRSKVGKLLVFIGEASDPKFREYNVELDSQAYIGLMRSGLPIYWVPCFDGGAGKNAGHASFWQARHADVLRSASPPVIQFFIYALEKEHSDPLAFVSQSVDPPRRARLLAGTRNLWCTAIFGVLAGRTPSFDGQTWALVSARTGQPSDGTFTNDLFTFSRVDVSIGDDAAVRYGRGPGAKPVIGF